MENDRGDQQEPSARPSPAAVRPLWWAVSGVLLTAAVILAVTRRRELVAAVGLITHVDPPRLLLAAVLEAASLVCLIALQRWLLGVGGSGIRFGTVAAVVLAGNAIAGALPGGAAFAVAWAYRQFRLRGVGQAPAAAVLAIAGAFSGLGLFVLLLAGVLAGGSSGPGARVLPEVVGLAVFAVVAVGVAYGLSRFRAVRRRVRRAWVRAGMRSRRVQSVEQALAGLVSRLRAVRPGVLPWLGPFALALLNWVLDLACLVACAWSLGIRLPWHGLLVVYALTQAAGALRLTPGGLGVVETSLAVLLSLYGLDAGQAIAVTILYRVLNYWALQPVGWGAALGLMLLQRRRRRREDERRPDA
ncbi:lysylphosphatidylglycerol synthase transmembrane domain-containing protein [Streptomyces sp. WMMB 322]|uniref:lysylphosphatidylglycerol synthase transmembrane domain-containing protein n=1 Tax=Streptomyces sp. WMMB 322 TaxID=1286821 RepID=UPI0008239E09|nr:lysylphosphatidylglycerol synthase transmembrane domain-containing protein [Streptomyces sp. WMMB 322]SCK47112.1 hypothetical protein H180DRAFT_04196 [Streptomyces sp. WMMB 322]